MNPAPLWARIAFAFDLAVRRLHANVRAVLEEVICAWVRPEARPAMTGEVFRRLAWFYAPGGEGHLQGLWDWEQSALPLLDIAPGDAVLVGAAGGGREVDALLAMGYRAKGFDPSPLATARGDQDVLCGSYNDLIDAVENHDGPLARLAEEDFDAVILGWGSLNHVVSDAERHALLTTVRSRWHDAHVLVSYQESREERQESAQVVRVRSKVRAVLGTDRRSPGVEFLMTGGFFYFPTHESVANLARDTGYLVQHAGGPYAHDILSPTVPSG